MHSVLPVHLVQKPERSCGSFASGRARKPGEMADLGASLEEHSGVAGAPAAAGGERLKACADWSARVGAEPAEQGEARLACTPRRGARGLSRLTRRGWRRANG